MGNQARSRQAKTKLRPDAEFVCLSGFPLVDFLDLRLRQFAFSYAPHRGSYPHYSISWAACVPWSFLAKVIGVTWKINIPLNISKWEPNRTLLLVLKIAIHVFHCIQKLINLILKVLAFLVNLDKWSTVFYCAAVNLLVSHCWFIVRSFWDSILETHSRPFLYCS